MLILKSIDNIVCRYYTTNMKKNTRCKKCNSRKVIKAGKQITSNGNKQRYQCRVCGHIFVKGEINASQVKADTSSS